MSYEQGLRPSIDLGALRQIVKASVKSTPPPAGFDPLTASQDDLKKFAFPVRPDRRLQPTEYAFWRKMFDGQLAFEEFDFDLFPAYRDSGARIFRAIASAANQPQLVWRLHHPQRWNSIFGDLGEVPGSDAEPASGRRARRQ